MESTSHDTPKKRILVVDDHPLLRHGLAQLINLETDMMVCGEAENDHQALDAIADLKPDLMIVDISLNDANGIELTKDVKKRYPKLLTLIISTYDESLYAERALRAGAHGYIMKREATENVLKAIRKILSGGIYLSEKMQARFLRSIVGEKQSASATISLLTNRELEVFRFIGQGHGTRQISEKLRLSIKTIESHRAHIKEKMHFKNGLELMKQAVQYVQDERIT